jgi:hypothetical protein
LNKLLIAIIIVTTVMAVTTAEKNSINGPHADRKLEMYVEIVF